MKILAMASFALLTACTTINVTTDGNVYIDASKSIPVTTEAGL